MLNKKDKRKSWDGDGLGKSLEFGPAASHKWGQRGNEWAKYLDSKASK